MDELTLFLTILVIVLCTGVSGLFILVLKMWRTSMKSVNSIPDELSRQIGETVNSAFGESVSTLTELANDKLNTAREATKEDLDSKKELIDIRVAAMTKALEDVDKTLKKYDTDSSTRLAKLTADIENVTAQTKGLAETTTDLNKVLNSSQARGQWGEKMADDVLQLAGFIEGINYKKQETSSTQSGEGKIRPDFTFNMPDGLKLNMDVKFPLDNYSRYIAADTVVERETHRKSFLSDVSKHIGTISDKEYINPAGETVDYVLMFIPNEGVYEFIYKNGESVIDDALRKKIIICSPLTMFAILSVIRQSMDNFAISKGRGEILEVLGGFEEQWDRFTTLMDRTEKQLDTLARSFNSLKSTRTTQLEKSLDKVLELKGSHNMQSLPKSQETELSSQAE